MSASVAETPMMRQFNSIKKDHPDKILFFRMGDFYEMFGDDAIAAAKVLQIALTSRNKNNKNALPMCGVPYHAYEQYLNKLSTAGFKVAICEQVEDPATAKGIVAREVTRIVTPGTTVSPQLIEPDQNHYLVSIFIKLKNQKIGVAFVDLSTGEFEVIEFGLKELNKLCDFVLQLMPHEILLSHSKSPQENQFIQELTTQLGNLLPQNTNQTNLFTFVSPFYFDLDESKKLLNNQFKTHNLAGFGIADYNYSISAAGALFRYLSETQKCSLSHITSISQHSFDKVMLLDDTTISNLEIFSNNSGEKNNTLYSILNYTHTSMGARLLRQWLSKPLLNLHEIKMRHESISALHHNFLLCEDLRQILTGIQDLPRIAGRISLPVVSILDILALKESLTPIQKLPSALSNFQESPLLKQIFEQFDPLSNILELLNTQIHEKPSTKLREGGFIADGANKELDELRKLSKNGKSILNEMIQEERNKTGITSLKIGYNKVFGYYLEVSNSRKQSVPDSYIRKQTLVNAERYITPELKELEERILNAEEQIGKLEYELFLQLKTELISQVSRIQKTSMDIATIDVLSSLAYAAETHNYICPQLSHLEASRKINITEGRHPVIEHINFEEPFIPNDIQLDELEQQIILITGPNMAGKSTIMRQTALIVLMAQCGSYVPAKSAEISIVDRIFTRVGASDNLSRGQSTFMVEMNEAASILNNATDRSLVILDEIGRGTSTFDGISIAWSIVEYLHEKGPLTLCATHYHELTRITQELSRIQNYNIMVQEEGDQIIFLRKIGKGEADKSYGVHVARLAGLPQNVVLRAMEIMNKLESTSVTNELSPPVTEPDNLVFFLPDQVHDNPSDYSALVQTQQLSLFQTESPYLDEIKELQLNQMTPIQALCYLNDLVDRLRKE